MDSLLWDRGGSNAHWPVHFLSATITMAALGIRCGGPDCKTPRYSESTGKLKLNCRLLSVEIAGMRTAKCLPRVGIN